MKFSFISRGKKLSSKNFIIIEVVNFHKNNFNNYKSLYIYGKYFCTFEKAKTYNYSILPVNIS